MLEFCEKLYFYMPTNGFDLCSIPKDDGRRTPPNYIKPKGSTYNGFGFDIRNLKFEIFNIEKNEFKKLFEEVLKINSKEEVLDFYNTYGMYINEQQFHKAKIIPSRAIDITQPRFFLLCLSEIKEIIDLIAARDSKDRDALKQYFEWSLTEAVFIRKYQTEYPNVKATLGLLPVVHYNNLTLPENVSSYFNNKKAADFVINNLMSSPEMTSPFNINFKYSDDGVRLKISPKSFGSFLYLYLTDSLLFGTKYKLCEICGKSFSVEVKPGREPNVCGNTCRARKFRSKPK